MGRKAGRNLDQGALRGRILDAARDLFAEAGYEAVTMRRIAERIHYTPTTIYLHFEDKAALLRELVSVDFLALAARFRALEDEPNPLARIRAIGRAYVDFALERPNPYRMMFMSDRPPVAVEARRIERGSLAEDAWAILVASVQEALDRRVLRADRGDAGEIAQQFFAGLHGVVALHLARADDPWIGWVPVREASERMLEALLRGFGANEEVRP